MDNVSGGGNEENINDFSIEYKIDDDESAQGLPNLDPGESWDDYFKRLKALGYC